LVRWIVAANRPVYSGRLNSSDNVPQTVFFEDLPLGGAWTTRRRTITAADLAAFAALSGDMNPLLIDQPFARASHFGDLVAPGALIAAVAVGLGSVDAPLPATVGMVGMSWKFLRPVKVGDTIQTRWRLFRKRSVENPAWGLAFWHVEVVGQDGQAAAEGEVSRLVARAGQAGPATTAGGAEAPARRRRRRRGGSADRVSEVVESAPLPDPAPADAPPPSRRRRRGRGGAGSRNGVPRPDSSPASAAEPAPTPAPVPVPAPTSSFTAPAAPRRSGLGGVLRRLRGS
jgi:3-hydroxybutyryl-CoA dehydratase